MNLFPSAFRGAGLVPVLLITAAHALYAQDPLTSWGRRDITGVTANFGGVAFGNGTFVAVGRGSTVATSPDGSIWTANTIGAYGDLLQVRFLNGQFVAVGSSDKILFSNDGGNWTPATLPSAGSWDVAYGNGTYVVAGNSAYVSTNLVDWTLTQPQILYSPFLTPRAVFLGSVVFGNGVFVALTHRGDPEPKPSIYSTNGSDWFRSAETAPTIAAPGSTGDLMFSNGLFLGTGHSDLRVRGVWVSYTGTNWCCGFDGDFGTGGPAGVALAYGGDQFLWVQQRDDSFFGRIPFIFTSTNATSWVTRISGHPTANDPNGPAVEGKVRGAAFGAGSFVLVGDGGYIRQSGNLGGTPLIVRQPEDRAAIVGNPASLSVEASGAPPLGYQWFFNNAPILGATTALLSFSQVMATNTGAYKVVITNSFGSVTSRVAQLSVSFLEIESYAGIKLLGVVGRTYRIEATPANGPVNWQTLTNVVLPSNPYIWIDYGSPAAGQRLYRAAELP